MANACTVYSGDVGLEILLDCGCDLTGACSTTIAVRTPSGRFLSWPATMTTLHGAPRYLRYMTVAGDLAEPGMYRIQASLSLGDWVGRGKTVSLLVLPQFA